MNIVARTNWLRGVGCARDTVEEPNTEQSKLFQEAVALRKDHLDACTHRHLQNLPLRQDVVALSGSIVTP